MKKNFTKEENLNYYEGVAKRIINNFKKNNHIEFASWYDNEVVNLGAKMSYAIAGYNENYGEIVVACEVKFPNGHSEYVKIGKFNLKESCGIVYNKKEKRGKHYQRLAYFQKAILKIWEEEIKDEMIMSTGLYDIVEFAKALKYIEDNKPKEIEEEEYLPFAPDTVKVMENKEEISLEKKFEIQLATSKNHMKTIEIFKEIFDNEYECLDYATWTRLYDKFSTKHNLGKIMHTKFEELVDATINKKQIDLKDMECLCILMEDKIGYEEFSKYDTKIQIMNYTIKKSTPKYEWFMKENKWNCTKTIVDLEKIYAFEDAGYMVEITPEYEEVYIWDVKEQLEGQIGIDEIKIIEEVVEGMEKEIKISIEGEGRVEEITTNNIEDANKNLVRRIKEVTSGDAYCNKTWITIDVKEFEEPIEFRVNLISSLHSNVYDVLGLIIEEKERECKYVRENAEKCTWIKDKEKFISVREELIKVLESYLVAPEPENTLNYKVKDLIYLRPIQSIPITYDIIFAGMNIDGEKIVGIDEDGDEIKHMRGIDEEGNIYLNKEFEHLRPLVEEKYKNIKKDNKLIEEFGKIEVTKLE